MAVDDNISVSRTIQAEDEPSGHLPKQTPCLLLRRRDVVNAGRNSYALAAEDANEILIDAALAVRSLDATLPR